MKLLFWLLLISAFVMGIYANVPEPVQAGQVNIPLHLVIEQQRELNARGHNLKEDGRFGKNTDHALTVELSKEVE